MKMDETEYTELYMELEKYEKRGIDMLLDGYQASPLRDGTYGKRSGNIYARLYDEWGWQYRNS